jgi:Outer membrane protein beta-barrel domain
MRCLSVLILALRALAMLSLASVAAAGLAHADVKDPRPRQWSGGAAVGFLGNTPDGAEFGLAGHAEYFLTQRLSVGPLIQYAGAGNDTLLGLSAQARYRWDILASGKVKLVVQGGIGVMWADIEDTDSGAADTDTSFVIPVGVGLDYAVTARIAITADLLVNVTSLGERVSVGGRQVDLHTNVMPGLFLGVRF